MTDCVAVKAKINACLSKHTIFYIHQTKMRINISKKIK